MPKKLTDVAARLVELAGKATPGPWVPDEYHGDCRIFGQKGELIAEMRGKGSGLPLKANLAFIASLDPATVTRLAQAVLLLAKYHEGHSYYSCPHERRGFCDCGYHEIRALLEAQGE